MGIESVPAISKTVKVYYDGSVRQVDRKTYVKGVIAGEAYTAKWYIKIRLTPSEIQ